MAHQGSLELLRDPVAEALVGSANPARLAYTYDGGPVPSCAYAPVGHYFSAVFDAATLVTLEAGVGNRPPPVPLQTLGPVLNLT